MVTLLSSAALATTVAVLCLTVGATAQNFTASTPYQNLTAYKQAISNFSTSVAEPTFPCGSGSSGLVGSYHAVDLDNNENQDDLEFIIGDVYNYFLLSTINITGCTWPDVPSVNVSAACSQVVAGTNYALELEMLYYCYDDNFEVLTETLAPVRTTVFVPLSAAAFETANQVNYGPVVKDIWFFDTPEVLAEATPDSEEEAPAPESAPEAEAPATDAGVTLLSPSGGSLDSGTTSFTFSPAASSSSPSASSSASTSASPTPEVVSGFSEAAQNQSIISG